MIRSTFLLALAAAPFLALAPQQISPGGPTPIGPGPFTQPCADTLDQEPLLMFDVSGFTLTGVLHQHLCVYDNGVVSISSVSGGTPLFPLTNKADIAFVTPTQARTLHKQVVQAGAFQACDEPIPVADLPLTTVTVFRAGRTDDRAHTWSYFLPQTPQTQNVENAILAFKNATFPNF